MAYTIGYIVYGLDLTTGSYGNKQPAYEALKDITDKHGEYILSDFIENDVKGFESRYSGGGNPPQWFGVDISNIDECKTVDGAWLAGKLIPTDEHKEAYAALLAELEWHCENEEFVKAIKSFEPKVMILWGSS